MKRVLFSLLLALVVTNVSAQVQMRGDIDVWWHDSHLHVYSERVENLATNSTELLRYRVWATENPFGLGGDIHSMGVVVIGKLRGQQGRWDVHRRANISYPDEGWWYITVTLEERSYDERHKPIWNIRDVAEFNDVYFGWHGHPFWWD